MKRGGELKRTPMRRRPLKKKGETDEQAISRDARQATLERDNWTCQGYERGVPGCGCCTAPFHVHHILRRSQGGMDHPANLVTLCSAAHEWVHSHPALSYELGLLQRSGDAVCDNPDCGHLYRFHTARYGTCTYGEHGMECTCRVFVEEAA